MNANAKNAKTAAAATGAESNDNVDKLIAEANLKVPAQAEPKVVPGEVINEKTDGDEQVELTVIEGGKKSLKERLASLTAKVKEHKKAALAVSFAVGIAAGAIVKYAAKQAVSAQPLSEMSDEEVKDVNGIETDEACSTDTNTDPTV